MHANTARTREPCYIGHMKNESGKSVLLYRAADQLEATLLEAMLNESGVRAWTVGGQSSIGFGELGADALIVDVRVPEERHAEGIQLIEEFFAARSAAVREEKGSPPSTWICDKCDQEVATNFTSCWNCESPRTLA